jgi:hypothetical protein
MIKKKYSNNEREEDDGGREKQHKFFWNLRERWGSEKKKINPTSMFGLV